MTTTNTRRGNARPASGTQLDPGEANTVVRMLNAAYPKKLTYVDSDGKQAVLGYVDYPRTDGAVYTENDFGVYVTDAKYTSSAVVYDVIDTVTDTNGTAQLRLVSRTTGKTFNVGITADDAEIARRKAAGTPGNAGGENPRNKGDSLGGGKGDKTPGKGDGKGGGKDGGKDDGKGTRPPARGSTESDSSRGRKDGERKGDGTPDAARGPRGPASSPGRPVAGSDAPGDVRTDARQPAPAPAPAPAVRSPPAPRAAATPAGEANAGTPPAARRSAQRGPPAVDGGPDGANGNEKPARSGDRASLPLNTPKYVKGEGRPRTDGYRDTMARLFLWLTDQQLTRVRNNIPSNHERTRHLLEKLAAGPKREQKGYIEFLLQEVDAGFTEKVIPLSGLADQYANYAFGANAPTFSFRAVLLNNRQDDQATSMFLLYLDVLRALQTAKTRTEVHLLYDQTLVTGTMINYQWTLRGEDESACVCTFQMIARNVVQNYGVTTDPYEGWGKPGSAVPAEVLQAISVDTTNASQAPWVYTAPVNLLPPEDRSVANVSVATRP